MSTNYRKGFRAIYKLTAHIVLVTKYRKKAINKERLERLKVIFKETLSRVYYWQKFISPLSLSALTGVLFLHFR